jgi:hypothetical protein
LRVQIGLEFGNSAQQKIRKEGREEFGEEGRGRKRGKGEEEGRKEEREGAHMNKIKINKNEKKEEREGEKENLCSHKHLYENACRNFIYNCQNNPNVLQ